MEIIRDEYLSEDEEDLDPNFGLLPGHKEAAVTEEMSLAEAEEYNRMEVIRGGDIPLPQITDVVDHFPQIHRYDPSYIHWPHTLPPEYDADERDDAHVRTMIGAGHPMTIELYEACFLCFELNCMETDVNDKSAEFRRLLQSGGRPMPAWLVKKLRLALTKTGIDLTHATNVVQECGETVYQAWATRRGELGLPLIQTLRPKRPPEMKTKTKKASSRPPEIFQAYPPHREPLKELKDSLARCVSIREMLCMMQRREMLYLEIMKLERDRWALGHGGQVRAGAGDALLFPGARKHADLTAENEFFGDERPTTLEAKFGSCLTDGQPLVRTGRGGRLMLYLMDETETGPSRLARVIRDANVKTVCM